MESIWRKEEKENKTDIKQSSENSYHKSYDEGKQDVLIIGAGMAGILTAYFLQKEGKKVLILEANEIASGQTEGTTAKITSQHGLKYARLIRNAGRKKAKKYAEANEEAINEYEELIKIEKIECDFKRVPSYVYSTRDKHTIQKEVDAALSLGIDCYYSKDTELPFSIKAAAVFRNQAQFSPLKFIQHLAEKLNIMEHMKVIQIKGKKVIAIDRNQKTHIFEGNHIVVTTHYPIKNIPGFYFIRQHQERSYVLALSGCKKIEGMYYGMDSDGLSFRQAGAYMLVSGEGHRTGQVKDGNAYENLIKAAKLHFPDSKIEASWSAQDCVPHDGIPFIGKYSIFTPNLYAATGFQKWGMTSSMAAARIISDKICGRKNSYEKVFSPQRIHIYAGLGPFLMDCGVSIKGLIRGWLGKKEKRCTHQGCELKWNPNEKTWDCPCHGSRFSEDGKLMDNPSKMDLKH